MPLLANIMQLLALRTAKWFNTVAQGRREAAHPGYRSKNLVVYAEGVTQWIVSIVLFNAVGVTTYSWFLTQGAPSPSSGRPWATVCNAYGV